MLASSREACKSFVFFLNNHNSLLERFVTFIGEKDVVPSDKSLKGLEKLHGKAHSSSFESLLVILIEGVGRYLNEHQPNENSTET